MDSKLKHIAGWVKSKGIKIIMVNDVMSRFEHDKPNTIFIAKYGIHGLAASILHEYYHTQQLKRGIQMTDRLNEEYRAEAFVIRCHKKLGIPYDRTFVDENWGDYCRYDGNCRFYAAAYDLLIKNKILEIN